MPLIVTNHEQIDNNATSNLSTAVTSGDVTMTVNNNTGFSANDYVLVGNFGDETAELAQISTVSGNTTINNATDAFNFSHPVDTSITRLKYNQVQIYRASTQTGSYGLIATIPVHVDRPDGTTYDDTVGSSTSWYKVALYNSTTATQSTLSDAYQGSGITEYSLRGMYNAYLKVCNDPFEERNDINTFTFWINEIYRRVQQRIRRVDASFQLKTSGTLSFTAGTAEYTLPDDCAQVYRVWVAMDSNTQREAIPIDLRSVTPKNIFLSNNPFYYFMDVSIGFLPTPSSGGTYTMLYYPMALRLSSDGDTLAYPFRDYTDLFINYAMYRFSEIHKMQEADVFKVDVQEGMANLLADISDRQIQYPKSVEYVDTSYFMSLADDII